MKLAEVRRKAFAMPLHNPAYVALKGRMDLTLGLGAGVFDYMKDARKESRDAPLFR